MSNKASGLKSAINAFIQRRGIEAGMGQNLIKEAIHLHVLSPLSEVGVLQHVVFQGGTALRLCYGGERYSEDLGFVCGKAGAYVKDAAFDRLVATMRSKRRSEPCSVTLTLTLRRSS
jgi:predicted nucleotidyltransferase component of viral defense system